MRVWVTEPASRWGYGVIGFKKKKEGLWVKCLDVSRNESYRGRIALNALGGMNSLLTGYSALNRFKMRNRGMRFCRAC